VRVCPRFAVVDVDRTSRLDNFTSANQVFPGIAGDWHQARDGMAAVSNLDRFPGGHFFEVTAGVLPQLSHPNRLRVLHGSTHACTWRAADTSEREDSILHLLQYRFYW
jgi:hypothetical protein